MWHLLLLVFLLVNLHSSVVFSSSGKSYEELVQATKKNPTKEAEIDDIDHALSEVISKEILDFRRKTKVLLKEEKKTEVENLLKLLDEKISLYVSFHNKNRQILEQPFLIKMNPRRFIMDIEEDVIYFTKRALIKNRIYFKKIDGQTVLIDNAGSLLDSGNDYYRLVVDKDGNKFVVLPDSRIRHSTLSGGFPVPFAGRIKAVEGRITWANNESYHYETPPDLINYFIKELLEEGYELNNAKLEKLDFRGGCQEVLLGKILLEVRKANGLNLGVK